jgi:RHS repeat-associated protein
MSIGGHDAYGNLMHPGDSPATAHLYCGEEWDPDVGLYYLRARYLNPNTGRFWTMDQNEGKPEQPRTLNKYPYCSANPVDNVDPAGHEALAEVITSFALAGGLAATRGPSVHMRASFDVDLDNGSHYNTDATVLFKAEWKGHDSVCQKVKLAQIILNIEEDGWRHIFTKNRWRLDTDRANFPWYPVQTSSPFGVAQLTDSPGFHWMKWIPSIQVWGATQCFEDCAICTDDGPNKYWNMGCVSWGHSIAGARKSRRWGDGHGLQAVSPSADFLTLFPFKQH